MKRNLSSEKLKCRRVCDEKEDFIFNRVETNNGFEDYWFKVSGDTKQELVHKYMDMGMLDVSECVYSKTDGMYGVRREFIFNTNVIEVDDEELKSILKDLVG